MTKVRFNLNCESNSEVPDYFRNRSIQLRGDNIVLVKNSFQEFEYGCSAQYRDLQTEEVFDSLYVLQPWRGKRKYQEWLANHAKNRILTTPECGLESFLQNHGVPHRVAGRWTEWPEYREIASYYGDRRAARSGCST